MFKPLIDDFDDLGRLDAAVEGGTVAQLLDRWKWLKMDKDPSVGYAQHIQACMWIPSPTTLPNRFPSPPSHMFVVTCCVRAGACAGDQC